MSHFAAIGLTVNSNEDLVSLVNRVAHDVDTLKCTVGAYHVWSSDCGAELWIHEAKSEGVIGITPYFRGKASVKVAPTNFVARPTDNAFEGALHAWADPDGERPESGAYPFVFDVVNAAVLSRNVAPSTDSAQIAAFAHEMRAYASENDFDLSQSGKELKYAPESFIPAGLFSSEGHATSPPESFAIFTGRVIEHQLRVNPLSGQEFVWAHVQTLGGSYDVVADPSIVDGSVTTGGIVTGSFWLCGLLRHESVGVLKRILGKWT